VLFYPCLRVEECVQESEKQSEGNTMTPLCATLSTT
jgi:hypothetical protein